MSCTGIELNTRTGVWFRASGRNKPSLFQVSGMTASVLFHVAERHDDGSRGLEPTGFNQTGLRRGATPENSIMSRRSFTRRSATTLPTTFNLGLKPTVTVTGSLREQRANAMRDPRKPAKNRAIQGTLKLSAVHGVPAERLLDAQQLIIFGHPISAAKRTGLDLAGIGGHGDVGDGGILGFAGAMADHGGVGVFLGQFDRVERFGERADLVHFYQNRIRHALVDAFSEEF